MFFTSDRSRKQTQADAQLLSYLYGHSSLKWAVLPRLLSGLEKGAQLLRHLGGGQGRGKDEDDNTREETDKQSAIEFGVRGSSVSVNQQVRNCKQVSFGQTACPVARPRSFGPPFCIPVVSLRFQSFLGVSRRSSGVAQQICGEHRLSASAVLKSRSDRGRSVSETGTTTREI